MKRAYQSLLYLVIALSAFLWLVKVPILTHYLAREMGIPISIEWVSIWPTETIFHHFTIEGPEKHRSTVLFSAKKVVCRYLWKRGVLEINALDFDGVTIHKESNNWDEVLEEIAPAKIAVPVVVKQCSMTHITIVSEDGQREIPSFELRDLRSDSGFPTREFLQSIKKKGLEISL